jgi:aldehyde dehydrogenase (NAD+)
MQESIAEVLLSKIRDRMSTLRIGPPLDKAIDIGAIVARVQLERIQRMVAQGVAEGATCWQPQIALPARGFYFPPTILSNVHPTSIVAQQEIFGPVLAAMTFRTPREAVELANNTVYGLASCVWSENINVALDIAAQLKAGVVWVNSTNLFDAACGFGGYRESGYGREGGREGLLEYMEPKWFKAAPRLVATSVAAASQSQNTAESGKPSIDRTVKQYIGGKQARPDSGYSMEVRSPDGALLGEAPLGNRKDIRNAVEAARKAVGWIKSTGHNRAQVLYYCAENLSLRGDEVSRRLASVVGERQAKREVEMGIERIFSYAAWADKFDGAVHNPPFRNITIAMNEPIGTVGVICPFEAPLLGFLSLVMPLVAVGNTVIVVPSEKYPLIASDVYQLFDTSDLPGGAVNIVTGYVSQLLKPLAGHDDVDAIWCYGDDRTVASAKAMSTGNLKQVWTNEGRAIDWFDSKIAEGRWFLEHATQVKNIWVPYGE